MTIVGNPFNYTEITPTVYLPQTGQTPTAPIAATAGMDGSSHTGIAWAYVESGSTTPATRFTAGTDAEADCITDNLTGLMWPKNGIIGFTDTNNGVPISQPNYANSTVNLNYVTSWDYGNIAINNLNIAGTLLCGHTDWYLPTINDLSSLVNYGQSDPAAWLNTQGFSNVQAGIYWSSTTSAQDTTYAGQVIFSNGTVGMNGKARKVGIWPVRLAQ